LGDGTGSQVLCKKYSQVLLSNTGPLANNSCHIILPNKWRFFTMNKSMKLTKQDLEQVAKKATALSDWLQTQSLVAATQVAIPAQVVTVAAVVLATGSAILTDGTLIPDGGCWGGCDIG
jgi:hypothetical protein